VLFIADIWFNLRLAFIFNGAHVTDKTEIRQRYQNGWLRYDVVAARR
jgi:hypothetical protein